MKNLVLFISLIILGSLLPSCSKTRTDPDKPAKDREFEYSKDLTISDADGNTVSLRIFAHSQKILDAHTRDALQLKTYTRDFSKLSTHIGLPSLDEETTDDSDEMWDESRHVHIDVLDYQLKKNVTGFGIVPRFDVIDTSIESRASYTWTHYTYGEPYDVIGAWVHYISESRPKEYMKVKLSKKTSTWNLFWQQLGKATLYAPGDEWIYAGTTVWDEYRLKISVHKAKLFLKGHDHDWAWVVR